MWCKMTKSFDEFLAKCGYVRGHKHDYQVAYDFGVASRQEEVCRLQADIDAILSLIDKHQYSSGERILKEVKELLK